MSLFYIYDQAPVVSLPSVPSAKFIKDVIREQLDRRHVAIARESAWESDLPDPSLGCLSIWPHAEYEGTRQLVQIDFLLLQSWPAKDGVTEYAVLWQDKLVHDPQNRPLGLVRRQLGNIAVQVARRLPNAVAAEESPTTPGTE